MIHRYFPGSEFAAFLFDFDGTIADTMPAHLDAWNQALSVYNLSLTREQHYGWAGRPTRKIIELINELHRTSIPADEFSLAKETSYMKSLSGVKPIVPVVAIIEHYHGKIPMAVVSGSRHKPVETTLEHLGLTKYFNALVCAEDYVNGKPAPDCFLQAASLLKVDPKKCLVFEDAELGIQSARNAGMACLRVSEDPNLGHSLAREP